MASFRSRGRIRAASINLQLLRHPRSEPDSYDAARFPSTINLTYGRRSSRLHQNPACGAQGSGRREPFSKTAFEAMACFGFVDLDPSGLILSWGLRDWLGAYHH